MGPGWWIDFSATDLKVTATVTVQTRGNTLARYLAVVPAPKLKAPAPQRSPTVALFAAGRNSTTESRCPLGSFAWSCFARICRYSCPSSEYESLSPASASASVNTQHRALLSTTSEQRS